MTEFDIKAALATYIEPYLETDVISAKAKIATKIDRDQVIMNISLGYPFSDQELAAALERHMKSSFPAFTFTIHTSWKVEPRTTQSDLKGIANIKNIIAVASGKGGVGKSTTTVNLALALAAEGAQVGILDADIYGPNQPHMLGVAALPDVKGPTGLSPIMHHGIQSMSMGYLVDSTTPMVWRGPMVTGALLQLLNDTQWQPLDYLLIDMPPGTGDIQLTLAQKIPVAGAVIITTPQEVALLDARRGIEMFHKVKVKVLGVIENMSQHYCSHCGHQEPIFGAEGGRKIADQYQIPLLGQLPLMKLIADQADQGLPIVVAQPDSDIARQYRKIAKKLAAKLSLQPKNYSSVFPEIIIENN